MLGGDSRDARRTERYLDGLLAADERHAPAVPVDADLDPGVELAAGRLRSGLVRLHPSFRFEESLATTLASAAIRLRAGLPVDDVTPASDLGRVAPFPGRSEYEVEGVAAAAGAATVAGPDAPAPRLQTGPAPAWRRLPEMAGHPSRPLLVGGVGVGVASAALSLGAYVAWRHSHPAAGRMGRAARAAHGRSGRSGQGRRTGVINGILGVVS